MSKYSIKNEKLLKLILKIDAIFGIILAVIGLSLTKTIEESFALPYVYILSTTLIILSYSIYTWVIANKEILSSASVYLLFLINSIWAIKVLVMIYLHHQSASVLGLAFLISELGVVLGFAALQKWQLQSVK